MTSPYYDGAEDKSPNTPKEKKWSKIIVFVFVIIAIIFIFYKAYQIHSENSGFLEQPTLSGTSHDGYVENAVNELNKIQSQYFEQNN